MEPGPRTSPPPLRESSSERTRHGDRDRHGTDTRTDAPVEESPEQATDENAPASSNVDRLKRLENEGDIAADYLEELLDIADLDGDLDMDVEGDRAAVSIVGADLSQLVGRNGEVLEALQELTRLAVYRETGERSRLMLDISGYRAREARAARAARRGDHGHGQGDRRGRSRSTR